MREKIRFSAAARHESLRQREKVTFSCENVRSHDADIFSGKKLVGTFFYVIVILVHARKRRGTVQVSMKRGTKFPGFLWK